MSVQFKRKFLTQILLQIKYEDLPKANAWFMKFISSCVYQGQSKLLGKFCMTHDLCLLILPEIFIVVSLLLNFPIKVRFVLRTHLSLN